MADGLTKALPADKPLWSEKAKPTNMFMRTFERSHNTWEHQSRISFAPTAKEKRPMQFLHFLRTSVHYQPKKQEESGIHQIIDFQFHMWFTRIRQKGSGKSYTLSCILEKSFNPSRSAHDPWRKTHCRGERDDGRMAVVKKYFFFLPFLRQVKEHKRKLNTVS